MLSLLMRAALAASLIVCCSAASAQDPTLAVAPLRLTFIAAAGGNAPAQTVQIRQTGDARVRWQAETTAGWIGVSPASGTGDSAVRISVVSRGLGPGRHDGQVTVSGPPGTGPIVVSVVLHLQDRAVRTPAPGATAAALTLSAPAGSKEPASSVMNLQQEPGAPTEWRVKPDQPWISVEPLSGRVPARVTVTADPVGLSAGEHRATLEFTDAEGEAWMRVPVTLTVGGHNALSIATDVLPPATRALPYSQAIPIRGGRPPYSIRIIQGRLPQGLALSGGAISGVARLAGSYPVVLAVTDASAPPVTITQPLLIQVIVLYQDTALVVSPPALSLAVNARQRPQGARVAIGSGRQPLAWEATADASWLRLSPERGISPSVLQLDVNPADLEPGTYTATVTITMQGAPNSPARIPVQVEVRR